MAVPRTKATRVASPATFKVRSKGGSACVNILFSVALTMGAGLRVTCLLAVEQQESCKGCERVELLRDIDLNEGQCSGKGLGRRELIY